MLYEHRTDTAILQHNTAAMSIQIILLIYFISFYLFKIKGIREDPVCFVIAHFKIKYYRRTVWIISVIDFNSDSTVFRPCAVTRFVTCKYCLKWRKIIWRTFYLVYNPIFTYFCFIIICNSNLYFNAFWNTRYSPALDSIAKDYIL